MVVVKEREILLRRNGDSLGCTGYDKCVEVIDIRIECKIIFLIRASQSVKRSFFNEFERQRIKNLDLEVLLAQFKNRL